MNARRLFRGLCLLVLCLAATSPVFGLANRVFVSARSGNDANSCDNIATPCQTFAGAVVQLNPGGEAIVLDSGGYGSVTITQALTIEAPPGVLAFIHPSINGITVSAGASDTVILRGLVLNAGTGDGIRVLSVGTLSVENCFISGFQVFGIYMESPGRLNVKNTDVKGCGTGVGIHNLSGMVRASIDHCHLDGNQSGFVVQAISPGGSTTTATNSTANNNSQAGWVDGALSSGIDVLNLEFCSGSENGADGLSGNSTNGSSVARYSNCIFSNNNGFGVGRYNNGTIESRTNNTLTGNVMGPTLGVIGAFPPM